MCTALDISATIFLRILIFMVLWGFVAAFLVAFDKPRRKRSLSLDGVYDGKVRVSKRGFERPDSSEWGI